MKQKNEIKKDLQARIKGIFHKNPRELYNYKQIAKKLGDVDQKEKKIITGLLYSLTKDKFLLEVYNGKFKLNPTEIEKIKPVGPFITGIVDMKQTGKAYVITDEILEDVKISPNNTYKALHGDKVKVRLFPKRKNSKTDGEIIEVNYNVIKHQFVGTVQILKKICIPYSNQ
jgi:ribonuclease R